jgi:hypothetical protein
VPEGQEDEAMVQQTFHGRVSGKSIELTESPGLAEGQEVEVVLRTVSPAEARQSGDGFRRTEGALLSDPYWDTVMQEVYRERKRDTRREVEE